MDASAEKLKELTGARTRIVWAQQQSGCEDYYAVSPDFKLMGLDTDDGKGVRCIADTVGSYASPMITPAGDRIVYTDNKDGTVHVVDWDGSNHRVYGPGYATTVWKDPKTDIEWVFIRPNNTKSWVSKSRPLIRHQLDDPSVEELMWDKSSVNWNWFQPSPDGSRAACSVPWPICGMATLPNGEFTEFDRGCWTSMAPDNSYRMWVFDGDHRRVKLYDQSGNRLAVLDFHQAPGVNGWEIYHPRWSNNVRFMTVTGPFSKGRTDVCKPEDRGNWIKLGGYNVELYVGRFDPSITKIEEWVQITRNEKADFMGDVWIDPGASSR